VIKYFYIFERLLQSQEIIEDFQKTLEESAPSNTTVFNWIAEFKHNHISIERSDRLNVVTPE